MNSCTEKQHPNHTHRHGPNCRHTAVRHEGHVDYLHDGHLHHANGGTVEEHAIDVSAQNPQTCTPAHTCGGHPKNHVHGDGCGHEAVAHEGHVDYLHDGHRHAAHGGHWDEH